MTATTPATLGRSRGASRAQLTPGFVGLIGIQLRRSLKIRSVAVLLALAVVGCVFYAVLGNSAVSLGSGTSSPVSIATITTAVGGLFSALAAMVFIASDYPRRYIDAELTVSPGRLRLYWAKAIAGSLAGTVAVLIGWIIAFGWGLAFGVRVVPSGLGGQVALAVGLVIVTTLLGNALGAGIGALTRNPSGGTLGYLGLVIGLPLLVSFTLGALRIDSEAILRLMPDASVGAVRATPLDGSALGSEQFLMALLASLAWSTLALVVGAARAAQRKL